MTAAVVDLVVLAAGVAVSVPVTVLFLECVAALWPVRRPDPGTRARTTVLVPAHDEEQGIIPTLRAIRPQLADGDRVIVIADNCKDHTADRAREEGAEVLERRDEVRRGKGFALAHGLNHLKDRPPEIVVFLDADTRAEPGSIPAIASRAAASNGPVQAVYLLDFPPDSGVIGCVSAFAFLVKNLVRPAGLARLGVPCHILGAGMAIPWRLIDIERLATGNLVEDMQQGIDLAIQGSPPRFCVDAKVTGSLPSGRRDAFGQRTRWEHGHLGTILTQVPRLLWNAVIKARPALLGMALDLAVPPLALLCLMWALVAGVSAFRAFRGFDKVPAMVSAASGLLILAAVALAWVRHARGIIPGRALLLAPLYVLWKVPLYVAFLFRRQKSWVRTARDPAGPPAP